MQNTYRFISSFLFLLFVISGGAQEKKTDTNIPKPVLFNGITIHADVSSLVSYYISSGETFSSEGGLQFDLRHKFYPIVEIGFAGANKITSDDIEFKTSGVFGRVGIDLNLLKQKENSKPLNNMFLGGIRIGFTNFSYDVSNVTISNEYWGPDEILNYNNQSATKVWYEIVAGVKVEVIKNIYMGWTVRNKHLLNQDVVGEISPWYIPGFGINSSSAWGFNYTIGYHF
ncbi:MAG: DUF6048 family protein [Paludibacter sp.]|nr:DUF6048 family protein [Paludibacter sp.]